MLDGERTNFFDKENPWVCPLQRLRDLKTRTEAKMHEYEYFTIL